MRKEYILSLFVIFILGGCIGMSESGPRRGTPVDSANTVSITSTADNSPELPLPTVNVYIENSGSMDGYVNGVTDFKHAIYSYLSDLRISDITQGINLFYINSRVIPFGSDISDFIEKLNPNTFRVRGGNRGTSDISDVLKTILAETTSESVSMMVSDCIFSPGKGKDADQYLINQQIGIKTNVSDYLKKEPDAAVVVYQLSSQFNGTYYNREDSKTTINERRPFYLWIIGNKKYISDLLKTVPESKFKGSGVENMFTIMRGNQLVKYAIRPGTGKFSLSKKDSRHSLTKLKKDPRSQKATFAVDVDFSASMLDNDYLKNNTNYLLSDKDYQLQITNSPSNSHGYTHSLNLSTDKIKPSHLSIKLKTQVPEWVERINDDVGMDIHAEGSMRKTYGIKYLVYGVYEAFAPQDNNYTEIKISINNK